MENIDINSIREKSVILGNAPIIKCHECGNNTFKYSYVIKAVSGVYAGRIGETTYVPIDVFVCDKCGQIAKYMLDDANISMVLGKDICPEIKNDDVKKDDKIII
jgi:hypothetical protein